MNPDFKGIDAAIFTLDGVPLMNLQPVEVERVLEPEEREIHNDDNVRFFNREYSGTLENIQITQNFSDNVLKTNRVFTIVGTGYKFPRGNKFPKKKRIRKKWMKKYTHEFELENCRLI